MRDTSPLTRDNLQSRRVIRDTSLDYTRDSLIRSRFITNSSLRYPTGTRRVISIKDGHQGHFSLE
jgi:hypothetical protein